VKSTLTSHEISAQGQVLVAARLRELGFAVAPAPPSSGNHFLVSRGEASRPRTVWVSTNLKPKPAGGGGPPALNWQIPRRVKSDVIALVDLSLKRVWVLLGKEVERTAQQHNPTFHHMIMVTRSDWTSAPHPRIRANQFEELLLERRASAVFGDST
jgi:hypothetical protein